MRGLKKLLPMWLLLAGTCVRPGIAQGQLSAFTELADFHANTTMQPAVCGNSLAGENVRAALRQVCLREHVGIKSTAARKAIVIGFVGGFVKRDDVRHPEVQFAAFLRQNYPSIVHAEVFANHDGKNALRQVLKLLDTDRDGLLTSDEKQQISIIIYGHSWGGSQVVTLARDLDRLGIPVSLTILVDSVHKPGHDDAVIPSNVQNAVNFYETTGIIHGRSRIRASDPKHTNIIGNFEMTYQDRQINCDNYPWIARHLNKAHHEIENDPLVWAQIASMIDSQLFKDTSTIEASLPSTSLVAKQDLR